jgi:hypothetical protein
MQLSVGMATSASERVAQAMLHEDAVGTAEVSTALRTDAVYANISTATAIQALMDVTDMTVDPMQLVMDDADPAASLVMMAVWGSSGALPTEITDLNAAAVGSNQINLAWTAAAGATSHRVERWED